MRMRVLDTGRVSGTGGRGEKVVCRLDRVTPKNYWVSRAKLRNGASS